MKRVKLSTFIFQPEFWNHDLCFKYRITKPLATDEVLVHTKATEDLIPRCWRKILNQWQWAYIPFKAAVEPTFRWELGTDIGAGLVLDAEGIANAGGRYLGFRANPTEAYLIISNGYGDGCHSHSLYLSDGPEKCRSLVSFGHQSVAYFTVKPQGATIRSGEKFIAPNGKCSFLDEEPHYPEIVEHLPQGQYDVMTLPNSGRLRVCKMR